MSKSAVFPNVQSRCGYLFCVSGNGTVTSNVLFSQKNHIELNVSVSDDAGLDFTQLDVSTIKKRNIRVLSKKRHQWSAKEFNKYIYI